MSIHASRDRSSDESQKPEVSLPRLPRPTTATKPMPPLRRATFTTGWRIHNRIDYLLADPSERINAKLAGWSGTNHVQ